MVTVHELYIYEVFQTVKHIMIDTLFINDCLKGNYY